VILQSLNKLSKKEASYNMKEEFVQDYLKITGGIIPKVYTNPEQQGRQIVKFSLLKATNFGYSNGTNLNAESVK